MMTHATRCFALHSLPHLPLAVLALAALSLCGCARAPKFEGRLVVFLNQPQGGETNSTGGTVVVLSPDPSTGKANRTQIAANVFAAAVSPDGQRLVYSTDKESRLRDLKSGEEKKILPFM